MWVIKLVDFRTLAMILMKTFHFVIIPAFLSSRSIANKVVFFPPLLGSLMIWPDSQWKIGK